MSVRVQYFYRHWKCDEFQRRIPSTALDLKVVQSSNSSVSISYLHSQLFQDCFQEEHRKICFSSSCSLLSSVQGLDSEKGTGRRRCCFWRHSSPCCHCNFLCWPAVSYNERRGRLKSQYVLIFFFFTGFFFPFKKGGNWCLIFVICFKISLKNQEQNPIQCLY